MDSSDSSLSGVSAEATQLLKNLLSLGGGHGGDHSRSSDVDVNSISSGKNSLEDTTTMSLPTKVKEDFGQSSNGSGVGEATEGTLLPGLSSNGSLSIEELMKRASQQVLTKQAIAMQGEDGKNSYCVYGREVNIIASEESMSSAGSNKVKINPVVNFEWEHKYYVGNLVTIHRNGLHVAYVLKGKNDGIVRVINRQTVERVLLKGFTGRVVDISFAHITPIVLGAVDEVGNMFVYEILEDRDGRLDTSLLLHVVRPKDTVPSDHHRLIWCPYIPEDEDSSGTTADTTGSSVSEDVGKLLVLTHCETAEMWNVDTVSRVHGAGPLLPEQVTDGYLVIASHTQSIMDAAFSPDGTALATASLDGDVKFFQVYLHDNNPPRCLHQWQPHDGKPVSSLFFMDDHKHPNPEVQFWKFAITGADNNREIKIWSCESWTCLQVISFTAPVILTSSYQREPALKACMDLSATYLILSDINRKVLYVLQLHQDNESSTAHVSSISEFCLTQPCLSLDILDACRKKFKKTHDHDNGDHGEHVGDMTSGEVDGVEEEEVGSAVEGPDIGVMIKMYSVHTRALQELQIRFKPKSSTPLAPPAPGSVSTTSDIGFRDQLSDLSMDTVHSEGEVIQTTMQSEGEIRAQLELSNHSSHSDAGSAHFSVNKSDSRPSTGGSGSVKQDGSVGSDKGIPHPQLLTPDAFKTTSPRKIDPARELTLQSDLIRSDGSSLTQVTAMDDDALRSARGSTLQNQQSPQSSITLTPASSRDMSDSLTPATQQEPSPRSATSDLRQDNVLVNLSTSPSPGYLPHPGTPPSARSSQSAASGNHLTNTGGDLYDFLTSSPASHTTKDFNPPGVSQTDSEHAEVSKVHESADDYVSVQRQKLQSTGSSSSTSLEVSEILEGGGPKHVATEEDVDHESPSHADDDSQDEGGAIQNMSGVERITEEDGKSDEEDEEEEEEEEAIEEDINVVEDSQDDIRESEKSGYDFTGSWPKAPNLDNVNDEAQRLAAQAIQMASQFKPEVVLVAGIPGEGNEGQEPEATSVAEVVVETHEEENRDMEEDSPRVAPAPMPTRGMDSRGDSNENLPPAPPIQPIMPGVDINMIHDMKKSIQQMVNLLHLQQKEIEVLRSELQQQQQGNEAFTSLQNQIDSLEGALATRVVGALSQHSQSESQKLTKVLTQREGQEKQKHDRLVSSVTQSVEKSVTSRLERTIRDEIKNSVLPGVSRMIEPIKQQLHQEMAQKLTATDALMRENIQKMVKSKQSIETLGQAAGSALEGPVHGACRDLLIPAFDRSCQNLFEQVNHAFHRGTQEYTQQLNNHMDGVRKRYEESRDPLVHQLQAMVDTFRAKEKSNQPMYDQLFSLTNTLQQSVQQIQSAQRDLEGNVQQSIQGMQDNVVTQLHSVIQQEVTNALRDQQSTLSTQLIEAMRSQAPTPVPSATPPTMLDTQQRQTHILQLLRQGQLNSAFQYALSASDLSLVMFVCETVNPSQVFNQTPCPLQQPVLLSLIQQLSADLSINTELKHKYLEEAVMNLDQSNPVTKEHMPSVLGQLCQKLTVFTQSNPQDRQIRPLRMLLMAAQSLIK